MVMIYQNPLRPGSPPWIVQFFLINMTDSCCRTHLLVAWESEVTLATVPTNWIAGMFIPTKRSTIEKQTSVRVISAAIRETSILTVWWKQGRAMVLKMIKHKQPNKVKTWWTGSEKGGVTDPKVKPRWAEHKREGLQNLDKTTELSQLGNHKTKEKRFEVSSQACL